MASQRITVAKIGGAGADAVLELFQVWSAARVMDDDQPNLWSPEQWPEGSREQADDFAERLHGFGLPVVYFVEWSDMWSMGDLFLRWLTPAYGPVPYSICANQHELFAYGLPDGGQLRRQLASAGPQQWTETDWFIGRLCEAVEAWEALVDRAAIIVLRRVVDGSALDKEVKASLQNAPTWLP